ncbi:MAG: NFACT family protein [Lachnospiraceae bacterium]|nr:NFACT family protein [Lachnospiraceae bacterium]
MAFDGITVAAVVKEMNEKLINGRLFKIAQPEADELLLTIKNNREQYRLLISASASLPLAYFTGVSKTSPLTAPSFCMLLRKHISNGRIVSVTQPGLERVININIEHLDEMGDLCRKTLVVELMGKHSNIIFCDDEDVIIDSIKHIPAHISSVRVVLPGRKYFIPDAAHKVNPFELNEEYFNSEICSKGMGCAKSLYTSITGFSPVISEEICNVSSIDSSINISSLNDAEKMHLYNNIKMLSDDIANGDFKHHIYYKNGEPVDFSAIPLTIYDDAECAEFDSISQVLEKYYAEKNFISRMRQRSADLRQIVQSNLSKCYKKYDLQLKQLKDTEKRDKYKVYGELITAYGYQTEPGAKTLTCENYYTGKEIDIPLIPELSPLDNAKKYFERYNKLKRTFEALSDITKDTSREIEHLESIQTSLDMAACEDDLKEIKEELIQFNYIRRKSSDKKTHFKSRPLHYISSGGHHIYVGKNNHQNEDITFRIASGNDLWFHAKDMPGSHVILKTNGDKISDKEYEEAARLAAHYSKGSAQDKVEVDYIEKKHIKKVNGGAPGFVIYHTNYSMLINTDISDIKIYEESAAK